MASLPGVVEAAEGGAGVVVGVMPGVAGPGASADSDPGCDDEVVEASGEGVSAASAVCEADSEGEPESDGEGDGVDAGEGDSEPALVSEGDAACGVSCDADADGDAGSDGSAASDVEDASAVADSAAFDDSRDSRVASDALDSLAAWASGAWASAACWPFDAGSARLAGSGSADERA